MARSSGTMKPGETRNPNGRPRKNESLTELMREYLQKTDPKTGRKNKEILIEKVQALALKGDNTALKLIWNYLEGMPTQRTELTGADGGAVKTEGAVRVIIEDYGSDAANQPATETAGSAESI